MPDRRRDEDTAAIRVSNLSENVQDNDLQELFRDVVFVRVCFISRPKFYQLLQLLHSSLAVIFNFKLWQNQLVHAL